MLLGTPQEGSWQWADEYTVNYFLKSPNSWEKKVSYQDFMLNTNNLS